MKKSLQLALLGAASIALCIMASPAKNNAPKKKNGNLLAQHQIENYVQNIVASLFNGHNQQEQKSICNRVTKKLLAQTVWENGYDLPIERTTQEVYQTTLGGIVDYVERKSFDLAKVESGNYETSVNVSALMRDEIEKQITATGTFNEGALVNYIGKDLEYKVHNACHLFYTPYQPVAKRYDEKSCRICFSHFSPSVPWIYLSPCGHDICTKCAESYFIYQNKQRCPVCNQPIDTYQIRESIYQPSAPWL